MRNLLLSTVAAAMAIPAVAQAQSEIVVHNYGGGFDSGSLAVVEVASGARTDVDLPTGHYFYDVAVAPDGTVYGAAQNKRDLIFYLFTLDLSGAGNHRRLGGIGSVCHPYAVRSLAFGPDGSLYGAGWTFATVSPYCNTTLPAHPWLDPNPSTHIYESVVFEINTTPTDLIGAGYPTNRVRDVIHYGYDHYASDMAFACDGSLYITSDGYADLAFRNQLIRFEPDLTTYTVVGPIGHHDVALAYDTRNATLYGVPYGSSNLITIDTATGAGSVVQAIAPAIAASGAAFMEPVTDSDSDGVCDTFDVCPLGDDGLDADGDDVPDACDLCPLEDASALDLNADGCLDTPEDAVDNALNELEGVSSAIDGLLSNPGACNASTLTQAQSKIQQAEARFNDYLSGGSYDDIFQGMKKAWDAMRKLSDAEGPGCDLTALKEDLYGMALATTEHLIGAAEVTFGVTPESILATTKRNAAVTAHAAADYDDALKRLKESVDALEDLY